MTPRVPTHATDESEREAERALAGSVDSEVRCCNPWRAPGGPFHHRHDCPDMPDDPTQHVRDSKKLTDEFDAIENEERNDRQRRRCVIVLDADTEVILGAVAADVELGNLLEVVRAGGRKRVIVEVPEP